MYLSAKTSIQSLLSLHSLQSDLYFVSPTTLYLLFHLHPNSPSNRATQEENTSLRSLVSKQIAHIFWKFVKLFPTVSTKVWIKDVDAPVRFLFWEFRYRFRDTGTICVSRVGGLEQLSFGLFGCICCSLLFFFFFFFFLQIFNSQSVVNSFSFFYNSGV